MSIPSSTKHLPHCDFIVDLSFNFCPKCGSKLDPAHKLAICINNTSWEKELIIGKIYTYVLRDDYPEAIFINDMWCPVDDFILLDVPKINELRFLNLIEEIMNEFSSTVKEAGDSYSMEYSYNVIKEESFYNIRAEIVRRLKTDSYFRIQFQ